MPTYQYQCTDCGQPLEVQQRFSDDALTVCPSCDGRLRKVFNAVGVVFKGSGFYRNDSRSGSTSSTTSTSTSSDSSASTSSTTSTSSSAGGSSSSTSTSTSSTATTSA
ncbi:FmdB family zinc ribbon protein [Mumia sp. DW29H23]|uniref:FmdB family zinc ribbon protein n=1 Tax=Mumia sp. DW29H23 TaxID=3421241 RepID=UPI003D685F44